LIFVLLNVLCFCWAAENAKAQKIEEKISRIEKDLEKLKGELKNVSPGSKMMEIKNQIEWNEDRIKKLEAILSEIQKTEKPKEKDEGVKAPPEETKLESTFPPGDLEEEKTKDLQPRFNFEIGGIAGLFAGTTVMSGEMRWPLKYVFGPVTTSLRLVSGLAQGVEPNRRYIPLQFDAVFSFPPGMSTGVDNYLGVGINYVVLTSGWSQGMVGGEFFYGVESEGFGGKIFGELGYGALRANADVFHQGVTVLAGYRREWVIFK
jgi:hypothetical protein